MDTVPEPQKTYKREVGLTLLVFLVATHVWGVFNAEAKDMARFMTLPVFTFAGAAFGLDALFKQGGK